MLVGEVRGKEEREYLDRRLALVVEVDERLLVRDAVDAADGADGGCGPRRCGERTRV